MHGFACLHRGSGRLHDAALAQRLQNGRHGCSRDSSEKPFDFPVAANARMGRAVVRELGFDAALELGDEALREHLKFSIVPSPSAPAATIPLRK